MKGLVLLSVFTLVATVHAQEVLKPGTIVHVDPSKAPLRSALGQTQWGERIRFCTDFNFDGIPDLMISDDRRTFGNAGGDFGLYLGTKGGGFKYIGDIAAHPLAVHLGRKRRGQGIITTYWRSGGGRGGLSHDLVGGSRLKHVSGRMIRPDDDGDPKDRAEYQRYFSEKARLKAELSSTSQEGIVTWQSYDLD